MDWKKDIITKIDFDDIKNREQKENVATKIANKIKDGDVIGFGSGSTSYLTICEIAKTMKEKNITITAIPTSYEVELLCNYLEIPTTTLLNRKPDWSFDGADEVNDKKWMIKGRGGAMFKEKLNIVNSPITYILIDNSKLVDKLGTNFKIPVECYASAINYVKEQLIMLGATEVILRKAVSKDGPEFTENRNVILDVKFNEINEQLEKNIKNITGVIESGLFIGYNIEIVSD